MTIGRVIVAGCVLALATPARAQSVEAEVLFREGKKLLTEGKIAEACEKLDASNRLEASAGTELNLADCREKNGQLATAWVEFRKAATAARTASDPKREAEAHRRATALEPRLSYLTVDVPDASKLDGLRIVRNGTAIDPELWNQPVPVDPGDYEIVAEAPHHERWTTRINVASVAQKAAVDIPALASRPLDKPPDALVQTTPQVSPTPPAPPPEDTQSTVTGTRKVAIAIAIAGVAGIAVGAVFGTKANDLERQSDAICPTATCDDPHALQLNSDAKHDALIANAGIIGGSVAVAGAVVLWFVGGPKVAREHVAVAPMITRDTAGLSLGGTF